MNLLWFLSALSVFTLQERAVSGAMTLNSVLLRRQGQRGGASVCGPAQHTRRRKRSWVWNQFFVLEEFTGDEPLYVGKVQM